MRVAALLVISQQSCLATLLSKQFIIRWDCCVNLLAPWWDMFLSCNAKTWQMTTVRLEDGNGISWSVNNSCAGIRSPENRIHGCTVVRPTQHRKPQQPLPPPPCNRQHRCFFEMRCLPLISMTCPAKTSCLNLMIRISFRHTRNLYALERVIIFTNHALEKWRAPQQLIDPAAAAHYACT